MIKFLVTSEDVRRMSGNSKKDGKPYDMAFQTVWASVHKRDGTLQEFPEKVEIVLDKTKDGAPIFYQKGEYTLHPSSLYVTRDGNLAVAPRLVALKKQPVAA
jgi:hypothetical protein